MIRIPDSRLANTRGQAQLTTILLVVGTVVASVWIWKRLTPDTQDLVVEQAVPIAAVTIVVAWGLWLAIRPVLRRRRRVAERAALVEKFQKMQAWEARRLLAFELVELNQYQMQGLESVAAALKEIFSVTLRQAVGDKQHRLRGMAASHLGVLQDPTVIPLLVRALDDDHAYVRGCAALGLGRMRAREVKDKLTEMAKDDWDQTVRSRAREALERLA
ncbi:MAG: HEAT repeat domain-containing protein [Nitrospiraceae bacterium]